MTEKFSKFIDELKELCDKHDVCLTAEIGSSIDVLDQIHFEGNEIDYFFSLIEDHTKPDNGEFASSILEAAGMVDTIVASTNITYEPPGQMKASELAARLRAFVLAHGDLVIAMDHEGVLCPVDGVELITDFGLNSRASEFATRGFALPIILIQ